MNNNENKTTQAEKEAKEAKEEKKEVIKAGVHEYTDAESYIWPENPAVREHLEWFRGLKLGFMMHWAPVGQIGTMESWPLSDLDRSWSQQEIDWTDDMDEFKEQYWALNKTFNPIRFRPDKWAKLAHECGFKYLLFTTKHHDGFCMFDTKTTDYKITAPDCPFSKNKRANIVKEMFNAFRDEGLAISAYFSKPDWHSNAFWHREFNTPTSANANYDVKKYPELWEEFVQYTHQQLIEITSEYGKIDTLWLDGGCVRPTNKGQDIRLAEVVEKIRATTQPHIICCDRTVSGPYENIVTPEQTIPDEPMDIPWETCMTLGSSFSFHYDDDIKPVKTIIHTFIDIVSKGGSLALNITPRPDGGLPQKGVDALRKFGGWLKLNGDGIYNTVISKSTSTNEIKYTKKGDIDYAFFLYSLHNNNIYLFPCVYLDIKRKVSSVRLLRTGENIPFSYDAKGLLILDTANVSMLGADYADCFEII